MSIIQAFNNSIFIKLDKIIIITTIFEVISYRNNNKEIISVKVLITIRSISVTCFNHFIQKCLQDHFKSK